MNPHVDQAAAREYHRRGWWRNELLTDDLDRWVNTLPDKAAIVGHRADRSRPETVTYRQLGRAVDRLAMMLLSLGVQPGQVVSFQLPNWWQFTGLALACVRVGAVANPILTILRQREVGYILTQVEPALLVVPGEFRGYAHGPMAVEAAQGAGMPVERICVLGEARPRGTIPFDAAVAAAGRMLQTGTKNLEDRRPDPDQVAAIQFTSGTTGTPKGVMHTHNTLHAATRAMVDNFRLGQEDSVLMPSAMAHATGYLHGLIMPVLCGMKVVHQDVWDAHTMLQLVEDEQVTWTMGATPFVADTVEAATEAPCDLSSLRAFVTGGAVVPPSLVDHAAEALGTELYVVWGMTENGTVTFTHPEDSRARRASSDGRPGQQMRLQVVDSYGAAVPPGRSGRVLTQGAGQFVGYWGRPDLWSAAVDAEGWFDTGDLARVEDDGYIRITGRSKDLVIRGGENVPVVEIEGLLFGHPQVRAVALVGFPDERLGERVCAVVVPVGAPPSLDELTRFLAEAGVAKHFWPERLEVLGELPRTASGKVQKHRLRERLT